MFPTELILQREARSDDTDKLGADFMAAPPRRPTLALTLFLNFAWICLAFPASAPALFAVERRGFMRRVARYDQVVT